MFDNLTVLPSDSLLGLIKMFAADTNPGKIDLGVGVYKDAAGNTPIMQAVKAAEQRLFEEQGSKTYFGSEGDGEFLAAISPLALGSAAKSSDHIVGCQTVGGTGALRLAAELALVSRPGARIWVGLPTWPNHLPLLQSTGLEVRTFEHYDLNSQQLRFDKMIEALETADAGDLLLVHACCHNPTGADLDADQWRELAQVAARRGIVPLIDFAYSGFADGIDADVQAVEIILSTVDEAMVAFSCSKSFGIYRERTGALFIKAASPAATAPILSHIQVLARTLYSTPADHGAGVVRTILADAALRASWQSELEEARLRIVDIRQKLGSFGEVGGIDLAPIALQRGMFSLLPLKGDAILKLRTERGIYMAGTGRINIAGLHLGNVDYFVDALASL